jgi:hypothetical protein
MYSLQGLIERESAREDAALKACSTRWLLARAIFGTLMMIKGGGLMVHADNRGWFLLALLLGLGGFAWLVESVLELHSRWSAPRAR